MNPGVPTTVINDLLPGVKLILQNRSDFLNYNPQKAIADSLKELTLALPFEELKTEGPKQTLTVGQSDYPVTFFVNGGEDYSQIHALNIFTNPDTNTVCYPMKYDTPTAFQTIRFIPGGLPAKWTRFGRFIQVGPQPNQQYTVFMVYQRRHPFNDGNLGTSPVYMPPEWQEIVEYCASYRMAAGPLRWFDYAQQLRTLLYGDPTADDRIANLGLIKSRVYQQQMDERMHARQLTPVVGRY
jgi:hypothetical protein